MAKLGAGPRREESLWYPTPKKRITSRILNELDMEVDDSGRTKAHRIAAKVVEMAENGNLEAIKFVTERVEGRITQAVEISGRGGGPIGITAETAAVDAVAAYAQLVSSEAGFEDEDEPLTIEGQATETEPVTVPVPTNGDEP